MKLKNEQKNVKSEELNFKFQPLTPKIRLLVLDEYEGVTGDGWESFVKSVDYNWLSNTKVATIYHRLSLYMHFNFSKLTEPKRCKDAVDYYTGCMISHLRDTNKRVSKTKVRTTVRFLIKHISRLVYHQYFGLKYTRVESNYKGNKHVSYTYLLAFIDYLVGQGLCINCKGFISEDNDNVTSLLIPSRKFVKTCIGKEPLGAMEDCLKQNKEKLYKIRERVYDGNKIKKVERPLKHGEKELAKSIQQAMEAFDEHIDKYAIRINGVLIPEKFFYRTFIQDFYHGGRLSCHEIQNKPKNERLTITIDQSSTVSLDFWAMHFCIAAELAGWEMKDHDPYQTKVPLYVNWYEVMQHEQEHGLKNYDPVRNICKTVVLTCLNARDKTSAVKGIANTIKKDFSRKDKSGRKFVGLDVKGKLSDLVDDIIKHNHKIEKYFNSDFGIKAQWYESQIAQFCVDAFMSYDSVCIPVHDSITVKREETEFGMEVMEAAYFDILGDTKNFRVMIETL